MTSLVMRIKRLITNWTEETCIYPTPLISWRRHNCTTKTENRRTRSLPRDSDNFHFILFTLAWRKVPKCPHRGNCYRFPSKHLTTSKIASTASSNLDNERNSELINPISFFKVNRIYFMFFFYI